MLLQIHDELILEVAPEDLAAVGRTVKDEMEHAMKLSVPIEATLKSGRTWYDVVEFELDDLV
jgi:DNA polymerase-1